MCIQRVFRVVTLQKSNDAEAGTSKGKTKAESSAQDDEERALIEKYGLDDYSDDDNDDKNNNDESDGKKFKQQPQCVRRKECVKIIVPLTIISQNISSISLLQFVLGQLEFFSNGKKKSQVIRKLELSGGKLNYTVHEIHNAARTKTRVILDHLYIML